MYVNVGGRQVYNARFVGVRTHISYQRARCGNERVHGAPALPSRPGGSDARGSCGDALSLIDLRRFKEARSLMRKMIPVARRVLGENDELTLNIRWSYAQSLYLDAAAPLDDLREAVDTLEDAERITRRVLGGAHPLTPSIGEELQNARAILGARESGREVIIT